MGGTTCGSILRGRTPQARTRLPGSQLSRGAQRPPHPAVGRRHEANRGGLKGCWLWALE